MKKRAHNTSKAVPPCSQDRLSVAMLSARAWRGRRPWPRARAIEEHTARLRPELAAMLRYAPVLERTKSAPRAVLVDEPWTGAAEQRKTE